MKIGSKMYVTDLLAGEYSILHPDNTVVCQIRTSRTAVEDDAEEEGEEGAEEGEEGAAEEGAAKE
jgi:large subunit ribosomal protein L25